MRDGTETDINGLTFREILGEVRADVKDVREQLIEARIQITDLKARAGIWGGISGMISTMIAMLIMSQRRS